MRRWWFQGQTTTYCTVPWKWHSDTAVTVAGFGSAGVGLMCGARAERA